MQDLELNASFIKAYGKIPYRAKISAEVSNTFAKDLKNAFFQGSFKELLQ